VYVVKIDLLGLVAVADGARRKTLVCRILNDFHSLNECAPLRTEWGNSDHYRGAMADSFEGYRQIIDRLTKIVYDDKSLTVSRASDVPRARATVACMANAFKYAISARKLWDDGTYAHSAPLVRGCYESTIIACWVQQADESVTNALLDALVYQRNVQKLKQLRRIKATGFPILPEGEAKLQAATAVKPDKKLLAPASNMEALCALFDKGDELYSIFKILSGMSHWDEGLERHLEVEDGEVYAVMHPADDEDKLVLSYSVALSLSLAARAANDATNGPWTDELRQLAAEIPCPEHLTLKS
jgi:hypothetical protein